MCGRKHKQKTAHPRQNMRKRMTTNTALQIQLIRPGAWLRTLVGLALALLPAAGASAASFSFSTGDPDGKIATLSRPPGLGKIQTETADDFVTTQAVVIS